MVKKNIWLAGLYSGILILTVILMIRYYFSPGHSTRLLSMANPTSQVELMIESPQFPVPAARLIESFESPDCLLFWGENAATRTRSSLHAVEGKYSLAINLFPAEYAGVDTYKLPRNWSYATSFTMEIFNPQQESYWFTVRVDDHTSTGYRSRFNQIFNLVPGPNHLQIAVSEISKKINIKQVSYLVLFLSNVSHPTTLYLDNLRLN
jgi:hypothetical protein